MRILCVHAHFDDYEFTAAGLFEMWRRKMTRDLRARVVICTDGKAGHHFRTRDETGDLRLEEQRGSSRIGKYEFEQFTYPNGTVPREACLQVTPSLLAGFWKCLRDFESDYLFCPPMPSDPLVGLHVDHVAVAEAVRKVAYMINVPHAFTPEYPADERSSQPVKTPVILNVYDSYMTGGGFDLAIDVEDAFELICEMSFRHRSQVAEWLPWVGRHDMAAPKSIDDWASILRKRFLKRNADMGIKANRILEFFTVTAWGTVPKMETLLRDFPNVLPEFSQLEKLQKRLLRWGAG